MENKENKTTKRKSIIPLLLSPAIWIWAFLEYNYVKFNFDKIIGANLVGWGFIFFILGVVAGIFTERVFAWGGRPAVKIEVREGENQGPIIRKGLIRAGLISFFVLIIFLTFVWSNSTTIILNRPITYRISLSCYFTGVVIGIHIPYLFKLLKASTQ